MVVRARRVSVALVGIWLAQSASLAFAATDAENLRALHEKVMRAHREGNPYLLLEDEAADNVVANRGEVTWPSLEERRNDFESYLKSTTFEEYRDTTKPVVSVSKDGTMGWVIVQVHARGVRTTESGKKQPLEFVSAWIELYQKRDGKWLRVGNVSSFKP